MTTFNNGPAQGKVLRLKRAPFFLRVCVDPTGKVDALDELTDTPREDETLFAYHLTAMPGHCHIRASNGLGGFFPLADYTLVEPTRRPVDAQMRDRTKWEAWCFENKSMADSLK